MAFVRPGQVSSILTRSRLHNTPSRHLFNTIKRQAYASKSDALPLPHARPSPKPSPASSAALSSSSGRFGPLSRIFQAYSRSQKQRPYTTQFYTAIVTFFLGDLSAQSIRGDEYDPLRGLRAGAIGGLASIPTYRWFVYVATHFNYPSKALSLLAKVTISQIIFAPISTSFFFGMHTILSGLGRPAAWDRIKKTLPPAYVNSCKVWPAATAFSFTFVGVQYHSVFLGVVSVGWMTYVSYLNRVAEEEQRREGLVGFQTGLDEGAVVAGGA